MQTFGTASPLVLQLHTGSLLQSRTLWCLLAVAYFATIGIGYGGDRLAFVLGDTDDATRLLHVRRYLDGAGWYDLSLERYGGANALVSHWSRLIDVPLALMMRLFGLILSPDRAELMTRALWPLVLLYGLLRVLAHEAGARAGHTGAALAVFFGVTSVTGLFQFSSGRIDHHNVMILATLAGLLLLARGLDRPASGWQAGAALGLALVIGYEPLALIVPLAGLLAVGAVFHPKWRAAAANLAIAMTVVLAMGLLIAMPPTQWLTAACDAVSLNLIAVSGCGAIGLLLLQRHGDRWTLLQRFAVLAASASVGIAAYGAINPACLAGPYGEVSADAKTLWLNGVVETQPLWETIKLQPLFTLVFIPFAALGLLAAVHRARNEKTLEPQAMVVLLGFAVLSAIAQMKFIPYATFLAALAIAVSVARYKGSAQLSRGGAIAIAALAANQIFFAVMMAPVAASLDNGRSIDNNVAHAARSACSEVPAMQTLNSVPKGLIAAHVNLGPYIAASSHHNVLAAPYHRLDTEIVAVRRIMTAAPDEAEALLRRMRATYLLICLPPASPGQPRKLDRGITAASLEGRLANGETVAFLEKIELPQPTATLNLWRLKPEQR